MSEPELSSLPQKTLRTQQKFQSFLCRAPVHCHQTLMRVYGLKSSNHRRLPVYSRIGCIHPSTMDPDVHDIEFQRNLLRNHWCLVISSAWSRKHSDAISHWEMSMFTFTIKPPYISQRGFNHRNATLAFPNIIEAEVGKPNYNIFNISTKLWTK